MMQYKNFLTGITFSSVILLLALIPGCKPEPTPEPPALQIPWTNPNATPYDMVSQIPPFFPMMPLPANDPMTVEGVELGRYLFWEKKLSKDNTISCGSCHLPEHGFSDPNQFSIGVGGAVGERQSMTLANVGWSPSLFWDGREPTLEKQIIQPVIHPLEMNQPWPEALHKLQNAPMYAPMFKAAFGSSHITRDRAVRAIAMFIRTMISGNSKYDKWKLGLAEFTLLEERGFDLFILEGGSPETGGLNGADCFHCHSLSGNQFTDYLFTNNGLTPENQWSDLGRGAVTGNPFDNAKFKTPTLRNIEKTAPYMHDGRFQTLEEVIEHYNSGGHQSSTTSPFMKYTIGGLDLPPQDKAALVAFLKTLTDEEFLNNPKFSDPHN
jgi:cytochrome c peroxidase